MAGYTTPQQSQMPSGTVWMVPSGSNSTQGGAPSSGGGGGESIWTFPAQMGSAGVYRGSGLHFMNFPAAPMALLPGSAQQLGLGPVGAGAGGGGAGEGHMGILAALNAYRAQAAAPTDAGASSHSQQQQHGGGGERHESMSTSES